MSAIEMFRERGYELVAENNLIKFTSEIGGAFFFYLDKRDIGTSILYTSEEIKEYTLKFHKYYERLAPNYGYETRKDTKEFEFNSNNGKLMYATVSEIISPLLQKVKQLEQKDKEIDRLNNIINELEKWLEDEANFWKQKQEKAIKNGWLEFGGKYNTTIIYENAINKLKKIERR